jgi:hypothetical protein
MRGLREWAAAVAGVTLLAGAGPALAAIDNIDVARSLRYRQTSGTTFIPTNGGSNAFFYARAFFDNPSEFDGGFVTRTGSAAVNNFNISGLLDCCGNFGLGYQSAFVTPATMNALFPVGETYTVTATNSTTMTQQSVSVDFVQDVFDAAFPLLDTASFNALQNIAVANALSLSFNSFQGNANAEHSQAFFVLRDVTANSVVLNLAGLNASQTTANIAANTFVAGHDYSYEIIFDNFVRENVGGVAAVTRSDRRTIGFFSVAQSAVVPEPGTWALMIVGFGAAGAALRRRRSALA